MHERDAKVIQHSVLRMDQNHRLLSREYTLFHLRHHREVYQSFQTKIQNYRNTFQNLMKTYHNYPESEECDSPQ